MKRTGAGSHRGTAAPTIFVLPTVGVVSHTSCRPFLQFGLWTEDRLALLRLLCLLGFEGFQLIWAAYPV